MFNFKNYQLPNFGYVRLPEIVLTDKEKTDNEADLNCTNDEFLEKLTNNGFKNKLKTNKNAQINLNVYSVRLKTELEAFKEFCYTDYIILVWRVCNFCDQNGIARGFSRGSVGGSLVCYMLGLAYCDPIQKELIFERFVSKTRSKKQIINEKTFIFGELAPDIDLDIEMTRRHEVVEYVKKTYPGKVSKIITVNTLSGRLLIKECGKIISEIPELTMTEVAGEIPKISGFIADIEDAYKDAPKFKKWCDENLEIYQIALKLRDLAKNSSQHASGFLISFDNLEGNIPLQLGPDKELVAGFDMSQISKLSTKLDILGLRCCGIIADTAKQVGLDIYSVNLDDNPIIYNNLQDLKTPHGLFQIEADTAFRVTQKVKPKNLDELSDILAIARPGSLAYLDQYVEYKNNPNLMESVHPIWDKILRKTYFQPLYQEGLMALAHQLFQFTLEDAENIRRVVSKKKPEEVKKWKERIYDQAIKIGLDISLADRYWKLLDDSAKYLFNKSHSINYASICALTCYLKFNHSKNFYLALLKGSLSEPDSLEEISKIQKELKYFNIQLLPPHLLKSDFNFKLEGNDIRFGLSSIKGVSDAALLKLIDFRKKYSNKFELFIAAANAKIPINVLSSIIQAGAIDDTSYNISRSRLVLEAQIWNILTEKERIMFLEYSQSKEYNFNFDIIKMILFFTKTLNENGKPMIKESRFETIKKKYQKAKEVYQINSKSAKLCDFWHERILLGYSYSYKLFDIFKNSSHDLMSLQEVIDAFEGNRIITVGVVVESKEWVSREEKTKCLRLEINDEQTSLRCMAFNDTLFDLKEANGGSGPKVNDIVCIKGKKMKDCVFIDQAIIQDSRIFVKHSDLKNYEKNQNQIS